VDCAVGVAQCGDAEGESSTVPARPAMRTLSPTLYWFSRRMKIPLRTSLKRDWAPRPMPTPRTPAEASSGVTGIPKTERMWSRTMKPMTP